MTDPQSPGQQGGMFGSKPPTSADQPAIGPTQPIGPPPYAPPYAPPYQQSPVAQGGQSYYTPALPVSTRPTGVLAVAIWQFILAVAFFLLLLLAVALGSLFDEQMGFSVQDVLVPVVLGLGLLSGLCLALGLALLRMRRWAYIGTICLHSLILGFNMIVVVLIGPRNLTVRDIGPGLIASIVIVVYLLLPSTRNAFRRV